MWRKMSFAGPFFCGFTVNPQKRWSLNAITSEWGEKTSQESPGIAQKLI